MRHIRDEIPPERLHLLHFFNKTALRIALSRKLAHPRPLPECEEQHRQHTSSAHDRSKEKSYTRPAIWRKHPRYRKPKPHTELSARTRNEDALLLQGSFSYGIKHNSAWSAENSQSHTFCRTVRSKLMYSPEIPCLDSLLQCRRGKLRSRFQITLRPGKYGITERMRLRHENRDSPEKSKSDKK
jgi:hypothetical protein